MDGCMDKGKNLYTSHAPSSCLKMCASCTGGRGRMNRVTVTPSSHSSNNLAATQKVPCGMKVKERQI